MKDSKNNRPFSPKKRGFPGGLLLVIFLGFLLVMTLGGRQNANMASINFSYQLENLVNLDLIDPSQSAKEASRDNLVTFSGKFRDSVTPEGENRYKFLDYLAKQHSFDSQKIHLEELLTTDEKAVREAADWYLHVSGQPIPPGGYQVISSFYDTSERKNAVAIDKLSDRQVMGLTQLRKLKEQMGPTPSAQLIESYGRSLATVVRNFQSPALGIGDEAIKAELRGFQTELSSEMAQVAMEDKLAQYNRISERLSALSAKLGQSKEGIRLSALRSVRSYKERMKAVGALFESIRQNAAQLQKARSAVASTLWFFNNKELSTRALEQTPDDAYTTWFAGIQKEWNAFDSQKGRSFKAPDQPLNLVLERKFKSEEPSANYLGVFFTFMPALLIMGVLYFIFSRQMKGGASGAMSFGKSPARLLTRDSIKVTFKDVAGINEAKEELKEVVDFLKDPSRYTLLGAQIPKGVLLIGSPGTGKTLVAKAVAGEADRPFFSISGSDFVEMFVGVGASRIRDLFEQAKKNAPCIVFIDEIDAVGRHRGSGVGGGHDEREQTLNQLLVEMDGFDTNEGVIIMAATNRPDVLDKALLRPGRFDRRVTIDLPDLKGRYEILKVHASRIKIDPSVDLMAIARGTPGCSGADLKNLLNEAALGAARNGRTTVSPQDAHEASDKIRFGSARKSLEVDEEDRRRTAYHEAGHAIIGLVVKHSDPVEKVTIIPRGMSLGATHFLPKKNRLNYWKNELIDQLAVCMGGKIAEEIFVGDVSSGAQQDIIQATHIARSMVCQWGMSEGLGAIAYDEQAEGGRYLGMSGMQERTYSDETAKQIDEEVRKFVDAGLQRAREICNKYSKEIELMTERLMQFETLYEEDLKRIIETGELPEEEVRSRLAKQQDQFRKAPPPPPPELSGGGETPEPGLS